MKFCFMAAEPLAGAYTPIIIKASALGGVKRMAIVRFWIPGNVCSRSHLPMRGSYAIEIPAPASSLVVILCSQSFPR